MANGEIEQHEHHGHSHAMAGGRRVWVSVLTGLVILLVFILYMITFSVREGEYAILKTFGKNTWTTDKPGLYWKWFPPVQTVVKYDGRLQVTEDGELGETNTKDLKPIIVSTFFTWRIADAEKFDTTFTGSYERGVMELQSLIVSTRNNVIGRSFFSDFITQDSSSGEQDKMRFASIEKGILDGVREKALDKYGIEVEWVGIKRLLLPQAVSQEVFKRMNSERQATAKAYVAEGTGEAVNITSTAKKEADLITFTARERATRIRAEGERTAAEFYKIMAAEPELHRFLMDLKTLKKLGEKTTITLDFSIPPFDVFLRARKIVKESEEGQ